MGQNDASTKSWSSKCWTLRRLQQSFARHPKENTLPLSHEQFQQTLCDPVRLCRGDSASTTGTLDPRRGKEDAIEQQIAGRWHVITLQEASYYVDHELLTTRFHATHYAGCAVLFNKDTFYSNVDVKCIFLHDTRRDPRDRVMEGEQGWVLQGVLSRAIFRCPPVGGEAHPHSPCHHEFSGR